MIDIKSYISMVFLGIFFILFSDKIVYALGIIYWKFAKFIFRDETESFKHIFVTKNSILLKVAGFVMIFAVIVDFILKKLI